MARRKLGRKARKLAHKLAPELMREVIAIALVALTILLVIAFFGGGGVLTDVVLKNLRVVIGYGSYGLPLLLLILAWRLFMAHRHEVTIATYVGLIMLVVSLAGLWHVGVDQNQTLIVAQDGRGGGLAGYLVSKGLLSLLNPVSSAIILMALILIGLVLILNVKISELFAKLIERWRRRKEEAAGELGKATEATPKINAKVPIVTSQTEPETEAPVEHEVLTSRSDPDWVLPSLDLLEDKSGQADAGKPQENAEVIEKTLANFGIAVKMEEINIGPTVTQYTLRPESNVKLSKITELGNNLELALAAHPIRIEAPIPGKSAVGIEVPNRKAALVRLKEIIKSDGWKQRKSPLAFALGRDISGQAVVADLATMPHLLIAGATGSGKSVMLNSLLMSLLYRNSPSDLKLILVDPKRVEMKLYDDTPHLLSPVITEPEKCISALKWSVAEMERRFSRFAELGKRNIDEYNALGREESMPFIIVVIDELADLMMVAPQDVEALVVRVAQKARATGIHLVIATQRPSVNVITGLIKANIPARLAFSTVSQVDSRTIIDQAGAEKLLGKGDVLYLAPDFSKARRIQGVFASENEIKGVTNFLREARQPTYNEEILTQTVKLGRRAGIGSIDEADDSLLSEAAQLVIESRKASASLLQRRLRIGYARSARLLDMLEEQGIVSAPDGARPRDVLVDSLGEVTGSDSDEEV